MGKSRKIKTKRIVDELFEKHPNKFTSDFMKNKILLEEIMIISSKAMKNKIAGYLTRQIVKQSQGEALIIENT